MDNETAEPDLTPMLDVVFIMLIFFIVTATFVKEIGLDVPSQDSRSQELDAGEAIVVEITGADRYYLDRKHVDARALAHQLARLHAERPELGLIIKPSSNSTTNALVYAMDVGRLVGLELAIAEVDNGA